MGKYWSKKKGIISWNKGLTKETDERLRKISEQFKTRYFSPEHRKNISNKTKQLWQTADYRKKHLDKLEKNWHSEIRNKEISKRMKLNNPRLKQILPIKDTSIEIKLQEALNRLSIKFEKHKSFLGLTQPDIFIEPNIVIYADGCYWHGCEKCSNRNKMPDWIRKRKITDLLITQKMIEANYIVLRFWEHDIKNSFEDKVLDEILFTINESKISEKVD